MKELPVAHAARLYVEPDEVEYRLAALGLERSWLEEAVRQGELQRRLATSLDPIPTGGFTAWARTVRILREVLIEQGWHPSDAGQIPAIVNAEETVVVIASSGNVLTGRAGPDPKTKNVKGEATARIVRANNNKLTLLDADADDDEAGPSWWVLLISSTRKGLFAELSCPEVTNRGRISGWSERIIIGEIVLGPDPSRTVVPVEPAAPANVAVHRRTS